MERDEDRKTENAQRNKTPKRYKLHATNVETIVNEEDNSEERPEQIEPENDDDNVNILTIIETTILSKKLCLPFELIEQLQLRKLDDRPDHKVSTYLVTPNIPQFEQKNHIAFFRKFIFSTFAIILLQKRVRSVAIKKIYENSQVYQVSNKWREPTFKKNS